MMAKEMPIEQLKYLNFLLGAAATYLYQVGMAWLFAYSPLYISSFLLGSCAHQKVGSASRGCAILNMTEAIVYFEVHALVVALIVAFGIGSIHRLLVRFGMFYSYPIFVSGFIFVWAALFFWAMGSLFPEPWYLAVTSTIDVVLFALVYLLVAKHVFSLSRQSALSTDA
jgi:hypothetical protein